MNRFVSTLAATLCIAALYCSPIAHAQPVAPPNVINFQGRLATPSGNSVPDGTYNLTFNFYSAATGNTRIGDKTINNVAVRNGTFAVKLDSLPATLFDGNVWLGIVIGSNAELTPRQQIVSVPYAIKSNLALTVPDGSITNAKLANNTLNGTAWLLGGNTGTNETQFLGTTDTQPLAFRTNNTERMRILANGNVGIGTTNPKGQLHVNGDYYGRGHLLLHAYEGDGVSGTAYIQARDDSATSSIGMVLRTKTGLSLVDAIRINSDGRVGVNADISNAGMEVGNAGQSWAIGTFGRIIAAGYDVESDARLKEHIETVPDALSTLLTLRGVMYEIKPDSPLDASVKHEQQFGFLAQEVGKVFPHLVHEGLGGYKSVNYQGIIPVAVEAIKAQQSQINALRNENAALRASLDGILKRLDTMERKGLGMKN